MTKPKQYTSAVKTPEVWEMLQVSTIPVSSHIAWATLKTGAVHQAESHTRETGVTEYTR